MRNRRYRKIVTGLIMSLLLFALNYQYSICQASRINVPSVNSSELHPISQQACVNESEIIRMIQKVNSTEIKKYLEKFVEFGPKWHGPKACEAAGEYIFDTFKKMGLDVKYQNWAFPMRRGKNVMAIQHGTDHTSDAVYLLCAHYDTWITAPGANDDGSGIAAMLTLANITSRYSLNHTICFLAVSGHECGPAFAYGSTYAARNAYEQKENIVGVLNLDMIGNTSDTGKSLQDYAPYRSFWLLDFIDEINQKYNEYFDIILERFPFAADADDGAFLDYGYDAMMFIQSNFWNAPNHVPEDDMRNINLGFLTNVTKLILAVAVELAEKPMDLQIQITNPPEGYLYVFDTPAWKLPGFFNLRSVGLRGITYFLGGNMTIKVTINSHDEIVGVWFILDDNINYQHRVSTPPYEFIFNKTIILRMGKHTIGVQVITQSGKTAYDEMDIYILGLKY